MLIAEFGNTHYGDMKLAKELIRTARLCGADLAKGQAFMAKDIHSGSMPKSFYNMCQLSFEQYVELIEYGRQIGIEVFFSIFSPELKELEKHQNWFKVAGSQTKAGQIDWAKEDSEDTFVSIPSDVTSLPELENAQVLYVCEYLAEDPHLEFINELSHHYERPVGYSDHTVGLGWCVRAVREYQVPVIEKHFCLTKNMAYKNQIFRDTLHGADAQELEALASLMHGRQQAI